MKRAGLGIIAGLLIWSVLWFALNRLLPHFFPAWFFADGTSNNLILSLIIVLLSFDFSFISGYANAIIANIHPLRCALVQGVLQLAAGVYIQVRYGGSAPLWFDITFLTLIIPGVIAGSLFRVAHENEVIDEKVNR